MNLNKTITIALFLVFMLAVPKKNESIFILQNGHLLPNRVGILKRLSQQQALIEQRVGKQYINILMLLESSRA